MVTRGIELRLRKLEGVGRRGLFFLAWGRTEAEIEQAVVRARRAGLIKRGNRVVRAVWPGRNGMPPSRWISGGDWSAEEEATLFAEIERRIAPEALAADRRSDFETEAKLHAMSNAELLALALSEPLE
jgi:hypothetical protein